MHRAGLCDSDVSACLSQPVCIKTSWFLHHLIAPWFRSLGRYDSSKNLQGVTPSEGVSTFDWYQNQWPWMTLNWHWTAITRFLTLHMSPSEPATKIRMKIDPHCQQQQCSPGIAVSAEVRLIRIFPGVRWGWGVKWKWGRFFGDFRPICRNISKTLRDRAIVTIEHYMQSKVVCDLSNGITFDALEWPVTRISSVARVVSDSWAFLLLLSCKRI